MRSNYERIVAARLGMNVRRFHTMQVLGSGDTVGHHSCGVALLIAILHPDPTARLLKAALMHDLSEYKIGDMPSQTKWSNPLVADHLASMEHAYDLQYQFNQKLDTDDQRWLRAVDLLDLMLYALEQVQLGNKTFHLVMERCIERVKGYEEFPYEATTIFHEAIDQWTKSSST
jgi:5'-deoxynucleotidase YfbR-like HD superfamily hydrolase